MTECQGAGAHCVKAAVHASARPVCRVSRSSEADASAAPLAQSVTLVPQGAVKTENGATYAFVVRGNSVERRAIKTGGTDGDRLEVTAGLKGGDQVVIAPPPELREGTLIVIR